MKKDTAHIIVFSLFFLISFSAKLYAGSCTGSYTYTHNGSGGTSYNLNSGQSLKIASGTYSSNINSFPNNSRICVEEEATFAPSAVNNSAGVIENYGVVSFSAISFGTGTVVDNYSSMTFNSNVNFNGAVTLNNHEGASMLMAQSLQLSNGSVMTNDGVITMQHDFNTANGTTLVNNHRMDLEGNFNPSGEVDNYGRIYAKKFININSGSAITNYCSLVSYDGFNNNSSGSKNLGLILITAENGYPNDLWQNNAPFYNGPNAKVAGWRFSNSSSFSGGGAMHFLQGTGVDNNNHTTNNGAFNGDDAANPINFYDATQTGSQIFDTQNVTPTNTIRSVFTRPTELDAPSGCSGSYKSFASRASAATDYGDAPASYGDAGHVIDSDLYLGATPPDAETGNQYSYNAYGDGEVINDDTGTWHKSGDEDGAPSQPVSDYIPLFPVLKMTDMTYSAGFTVNNAKPVTATLYGWIDFDHDGVFSEDEAASVAVPAGSLNTTVDLSWNVPVDIDLGTTFIRLRLTTDSSVNTTTPTGLALDGEVEDFAIAVAMDIPPDSNALSITTGAAPQACQSVVFSDDFDDLTAGDFIGPNRGGTTVSIRDWVATGGGTDTYARTVDSTGLTLGTSMYFGNGAVRRVSPAIGSGFSFDTNGRMTTALDAVELRDNVDDSTPGTTLASYASASDWGPQAITFSRSFATEVGKKYRLYFKAIPEDIGGSFVAGVMRLDMPGGSIHFKTPGSHEGVIDYAVEFTATSTNSTITFVNYGHVYARNNGWCDPASEYNNNPWCTVGGGDHHSNELIIDNVMVAESACHDGQISGFVYVDDDSNDSYSAADDTALPDITVSLFDDTSGSLLASTVTAADGSYSFGSLADNLNYLVQIDDSDTDLPSNAVSGTPNPLAGLLVSGNTILTNQNFGFDLSGGACPTGYNVEAQSGYAVEVIVDQGVSRETQALGAPSAVGTNPDTGKGGLAVAALVAENDKLVLDLGKVVEAGSELELSLTRNDKIGRIEIATSVDNVAYNVVGTYGHSGSLVSPGTKDSLERVTITVPAASARYIRFIGEAGGVYVDAVTYSSICTQPTAGEACGPVMTSIMPSGAITHADNVNRSAVIGFDYALRGTAANTPDPVQIASASEVGTIWGKAYDEADKALYVSAFLRRHAGLSPDGLGAIYKIDVSHADNSASVGTPVLWLDLNSTTHLGSGATLFPHETDVNRGLSGAFTPSRDAWAFNRVGKEGIGGLDLSDDFSTLYAVDMTNRQLLVVDTDSKQVVARHAINDPGCAGGAGDVRPFGVDYLQGNVYVGVTCSGETNRSNDEVAAFVMKLSDGSFTPVVSGARGFKWSSFWDDDPYGGGTCDNPNFNKYVPVITNMQLDENGNMLIGVTSINGFRYGSGNYLADNSCFTQISLHETYGYVLRATPSGSNWVLSADELHNGSYGNGFKHFFSDGQYAHWGIGASHSYLGGLAVSSCAGPEVAIVNLMDALNYESAGTRYMRTADGQHETATFAGDIALSTSTASTLEHYQGIGSTWEKSSGMGDIEFLSSPAVSVDTGSIFGKVYLDDNGNDSFDSATESGIASVTVSLLNQSDGSVISTTASAADGSYGFTSLDASKSYRLQVDVADTDLPDNAVIGTANPLTAVVVSPGNVTADQDFGFDAGASTLTTVGEYRFDDCGGEEWLNDYSIYANTATGTKKAVHDDGKDYACTSLSAYKSYVEVPHIPSYEMTEGAVSLLVYDHHNVWGSARLLEKTDTGGGNDRFDLKMKRSTDSQHGTFSVELNGHSIETGETYFTVAGNGSDLDTDWVHVIFTFGPQGMRLYVDGQLKGTNAYTGGFNHLDSAFKLPYFSGYYDEFYILDGQPTDAQVQTIHTNLLANKNLNGTDRSCDCSNPVAAISGVVYLDENGNDLYDAVMGSGAGNLQDDLLVLYRFGAGSGNTVYDLSGVGNPMNLTIADPDKVEWLSGGGLSVKGNTILKSGADTKLTSALQASNEVTLEAWVRPERLNQHGPARIVTFSKNPSSRNFTLGQQNSDYNVRLRTSTNSNNGNAPATNAADVVDTALQHVVYTRTANGTARIYVNGSLATYRTVSGHFSNLDSSHIFALANEITTNRPWQGDFYKVALYQRALSETEVSALFADGFADGEPVLANVTVSLYNDNGTGNTSADDTFVGNTTTAADGSYGFYGLDAELTYRVEVDVSDPDLPAGSVIGTTNPLTVAVSAGIKTTGQNFGFDTSNQPPFTCDSSTYIASSGSSTLPSQFYVLDTSSSPFILNAIGETTHGHNYNAMGYREQDNYIYGVKLETSHIIRIGSDGSVVDLGAATGLPVPAGVSSSYNSGDVFPDGYLYVHEIHAHPEIYKIDVTTFPPQVVEIINLNQSILLSDFAWNSVDGKIYGIGDQGEKFMIDPATSPNWTVTAVGSNAPAASYGAAYTDNQGNVYIYKNNPGTFYQVDFGLNGTGTGAMTELSGAPNVSYNDGASCRGAAPVDLPGAVSGHVYNDNNANDTFDVGSESGIADITVTLMNDADGSVLATTSTAADGSYSFSGLDAQLTYRLATDNTDPDLPAGRFIGTPHPLTGVSVPANGTLSGQDFGFDAGASTLTTVGEYRFDDCGGEEWLNDYSIYANTATGTKKAVHDDGKDYACTSLSAYKSYVEVPHIPSYEMTEGAVSLLVYDHHNVWSSARLLEKTDTGGGNDRFDLKMKRSTDSQHGTFSVELNGHSIETGETYFTVAGNGSDLDTDWVHVMFTFGPQGMRLYVDGQLKGTNAYTGGFNHLDSAFKLPYFSGYYDEFYILDGQPTDAQVQTIYTNLLANKNLNGTDRSCDCSNPVAAISGVVYLDENGNDLYDAVMGSDAGNLQDDLLVLYRFGAGSGNTVYDLSGVGNPMNLTIADPDKVEWLSGGGLSVKGNTILKSGADTKLTSALQASNEVTLEAWVRPERLNQHGPARIVTFSKNPSSRNFTLGQQNSDYNVRLRTSTNSNNGNAPATNAAGVVDTALQHVVYTRTANGTARIYVNGSLATYRTVSGHFSNLDGSHIFALANEITTNRPWQGDFYKVALYQRALNETEVSALFADGEPVLANVTISLYNDNGTGNTSADDTFVGNTTTAADGSYGFYGLDAELTYRVEVDVSDPDLPAGSVIGTTNPLTGVGGSEPPLSINFGFDQGVDLGCSLVVTTTEDSDNAGNNSGSLRDAIECANETAGANTITFNMPVSEAGYDAGSGVWTIMPDSALPKITDADTTINATTQTGTDCAVTSRSIVVELDGSNAGTVTAGLEAVAERTAIRGMAVNSFTGVGVYFNVSGANAANASSITCSNVGTDAAGMAAKPNTDWGVRVKNSTDVLIGGSNNSDRNIISGNKRSGVFAENGDRLRVENNYIGVNQAGSNALGNGTGTVWSKMGIDLWPGSSSGTSDAVIRNNVISGNVSFGLGFDRSSDNTIVGNIIGLNAAGTAAIPNGDSGIHIKESSNLTIGGTNAADRNIIAGNDNHGIGLNNAGSVDNIVIKGNYFGVGVDGTTDLPNTHAAIGLYNATNITIGGANAGEGNVINSQRYGILSYGTDHGRIQGNTIGATADQAAVLDFEDAAIEIRNDSDDWTIGGNNAGEGNLIVGGANSALGGGLVLDTTEGAVVRGNRIGLLPDGSSGQNTNNIYVLNSAQDIMIGGVGASDGNIIAGATLHGLMINSSTSPWTTVSVLGNSIYDNADHGIDLEGNGVSFNDAGDTDHGPNEILNHPIITNVVQNGANVDVEYKLDVPVGRYWVEYFDNPSGIDATGHGEGETLVTTQTISHSGMGTETFTFTLSGVTLSDIDNLTMTVTELSGGSPPVFGATSEFSGISYEVSGLVFEDLQYGGGNGRPFGTAGTVGANGVRLEIYDATGQLLGFTDSLNDGSQDGVYSLSVSSGGQYYVRAVSQSVSSSRTGSNGSELGVMTFRTDGVTDVVSEVGGRNPAAVDAGNNDGSSTLNTTSFTFTGGSLDGQQAQAVQPVILDVGNLSGVSFGFNFNTIVNTNADDQGSLAQFIHNSNLLDSSGITQSLPAAVAGDYTIGDTVAVFMIPTSLLSSNEAVITPSAQIRIAGGRTVIDGRVQQANIGSGEVIIRGDGSLQNGIYLTELADGSVLRKISIESFGLSGVVIYGTGGTGLGATIKNVTISDNGQYGIWLQTGSVAAENNKIIESTISNNTWAGINNEGASNNTYTRNSIVNNDALGIDLGSDGVTANSNSDVWLNYPEIDNHSSVSSNGTRIVTYDFDLDVPANIHGYRVEFFSNTTADPTGHGEGETYLGYVDLMHPGGGLQNFKGSFNANQAVAENANIAVTLTEKTATDSFGATSEFSGINNGSLSVCTDLLADPDAPLPHIVLDENTTTVTYLEGRDADDNPVTYAISGGADAEHFVIHPAAPDALFDCVTIEFISDSGTIITKKQEVPAQAETRNIYLPPPGNYEAPMDQGRDNVYDLEITVTDSEGHTVTKPVSVMVRDVNEKPHINSAAEVEFEEQQSVSTVVIDLEAYDPDAGDEEGSGLTYSISGADAEHFQVDRLTGELRFSESPNYDQPLDNDRDNNYVLNVRVADDQGYSDSKTLKVTVTDNPDLGGGLRLNLKALLQGAYDQSTGLMNDSLLAHNILPVSQPYTALPFAYQGTETLNFDKVNTSGDEAVVDWVLVELRDRTDPVQVIAAQAAVLLRNGSVSDATLSNNGLSFSNLNPGRYYVSLRHRNHLGVMTATPITLGTTTELIDFTDPETGVYGEHARFTDGTTAWLWAGDVSHDGQLILSGQGSDINLILAEVLTANGNTAFNSSYQVPGYHAADLNMDGKIIFTGPANDTNILLGNILLHPGNTSLATNFIVQDGLPLK